MRLAFVDVVFSWPPLGGAPLDLYYTMKGLQEIGHEVCLFYGAQTENWLLDPVQEERLPFKAVAVPISRADTTSETMGARFRDAVDAWRPDVVFQCFGFFMKPYITLALSHYPQIARYYAYEPFCPRDYRMYLKKNCPKITCARRTYAAAARCVPSAPRSQAASWRGIPWNTSGPKHGRGSTTATCWTRFACTRPSSFITTSPKTCWAT